MRNSFGEFVKYHLWGMYHSMSNTIRDKKVRRITAKDLLELMRFLYELFFFLVMLPMIIMSLMIWFWNWIIFVFFLGVFVLNIVLKVYLKYKSNYWRFLKKEYYRVKTNEKS